MKKWKALGSDYELKKEKACLKSFALGSEYGLALEFEYGLKSFAMLEKYLILWKSAFELAVNEICPLSWQWKQSALGVGCKNVCLCVAMTKEERKRKRKKKKTEERKKEEPLCVVMNRVCLCMVAGKVCMCVAVKTFGLCVAMMKKEEAWLKACSGEFEIVGQARLIWNE